MRWWVCRYCLTICTLVLCLRSLGTDDFEAAQLAIYSPELYKLDIFVCVFDEITDGHFASYLFCYYCCLSCCYNFDESY